MTPRLVKAPKAENISSSASWPSFIAIAVGILTLLLLTIIIFFWSPTIHEKPGNAINAVAAAANVTFVVFNYLILRAAHQQIDAAKSEMSSVSSQWKIDHDLTVQQFTEERETNLEQLEMARKSYEEALKARLDQAAPRISLSLTNVTLEDASGTVVEQGQIFEQSDTEKLTLRLTWALESWDDNPVKLFFPGAGDWAPTGNSWIEPGAKKYFRWSQSLSTRVWHAITRDGFSSTANNPWQIERLVQASSLGNEVYDNHTWSGQVKPFELDGSRLVVGDPNWWVNAVPLAHRERFYHALEIASKRTTDGATQ